MRYLFFILLVLEVSKCYAIKANEEINIKFHDDPQKIYSFHLDKNYKEIKHGIYIEIGDKDSIYSIKRIEFYFHGIPDGIWIIQDIIGISKIYFKNGNPYQIISYDYWGKEAAACLIKNNKPYKGNIWSYAIGINGLKFSKILHYQEGECISEAPFEEKKILKLLEKLAEIKVMGK